MNLLKNRQIFNLSDFSIKFIIDTAPVLEAVTKAIDKYGTPAIINSDQGSQFTGDVYINFLKEHKIRQSINELDRKI